MLNISKIFGKLIKNSSQREIGRLRSIIEKINNFEPKIKEISDIDFHEKTIKLQPNNPSAYNNLANTHKAQGNFSEAINCYLKAIKLKMNL